MKILLCFGALLGFIAVGAGAFGAHALKSKLSHDMLAVFEVGVRYQMYHALAILIAALLAATTAGWFFLGGTVLFSGSLYLLALTGVKIFGMITPIGGVILLFGWGILFFKAIIA